ISLMREHKVPPSPANYAVWFEYVVGTNKELVKEMDTRIAQKLPFSPDICDHLYRKYHPHEEQQRHIQDSTENAQKILFEMLSTVGDFSGEASDQSQKLSQSVEKMSNATGDVNFQEMVREIIATTANMKEKSANLNDKLAESRKEIEKLKA